MFGFHYIVCNNCMSLKDLWLDSGHCSVMYLIMIFSIIIYLLLWIRHVHGMKFLIKFPSHSYTFCTFSKLGSSSWTVISNPGIFFILYGLKFLWYKSVRGGGSGWLPVIDCHVTCNLLIWSCGSQKQVAVIK